MRILVIGATGNIGSALVRELGPRHVVIAASHARSELKVDLSNTESIRGLFQKVGSVDAVVSATGIAAYGPLLKLSDSEFDLGIRDKLMGQVNLVRIGIDSISDRGSFTLTGGLASRFPFPEGGASISMANAGLEGFVRAAALELPRGVRINVVAPGWVRETLVMLKLDPLGGLPAATVAQKYVEAVEGVMTGQVIDAG